MSNSSETKGVTVNEYVKPSHYEVAGTIWRASHADEGTISATGADIIAHAILALLPGRTEAEVKAEALREAATSIRGEWNHPVASEVAHDLEVRAGRTYQPEDERDA